VDVHRRLTAAVEADVGDPRHDVERADAEDVDPSTGRVHQIVDDEPELEHPVLALGPRLFEEAMGFSYWHG
jgi:hypothetical protein